MKYKLQVPDISIMELNRLNAIATYLGYNFKFEFNGELVRKAFFETDDKNIGYIQKNHNNKMFIVWKFDESIQYIDDLYLVCGNLKKFDIIPEALNKVKMALGINALTNTVIEPHNLAYICQKS